MTQFDQSVAWWCFVPNYFSPETFARTIAELGYAGVDLVPEEHWPLLRDHGLRIAAVGGHGSLTVGLNRREEHDRIERELRAKIALAEQWDIPNLICFSGNRVGANDQQGAETTAEGLRRVASVAEDAGITLVLELLNSKVDHADYQADHAAWGVQVCQMVDSPRVKLLYDIYHMQVMEGDIIRTVREAAPYVGHYHTAGNPGRHEIGAAQELNYPAIFHAIAETGYNGFVAHEFVPAGDARAALAEAFALGAGNTDADGRSGTKLAS